MYASAPVNATIPSRVEVSEGRAEVTIEAGESLWHAGGSLHGSVYFKGLDDAAFFAANSVVEDAFVLTAKFEVELLAKVTAPAIRAVGAVERREGRKVWARSELFAGEELVARGQGLFVVSGMALDAVPGYRDG